MNIDSRYKMMVLAAAAMAASALSAMPTKNDLAKAQPLVNELMGPLVNSFRAKKTKASEVGAKAEEYAREAETEAAKFLLLKGAITYYSHAEEYDKAADAVDELDRAVKDIPPDTMLDIISRATSRIGEANAPRLYAQYRLVSARSQAEKMVAKMKALAAKRPADDTVRRRYAEALAASGNWSAALDEFAKAKGKPGEIAAAEKSGKGVSGDIASFWWDYEPEEQYASEAIKRHAAEFYQKAFADGSISGLKKTLAEKRVASLGPVVESGAAAAAAPVSEPEKPATTDSSEYCVIDVSNGPNASKYAVTYLSKEPQGGWTNDDRTKKIVLRRVKAGKDPLGRYSISKDYYIGAFEITQKQWEYVMGKNPAESKNDVSPATMVSVADIRGVTGGDSIGRNGFAGKLAAKSGLAGFDLPTEVQWEYAWRVGAATKLDAKIWERCRDNNNPFSGVDPVGDTSGRAVANCKYEGKAKPGHATTNKINPLKDRGFRIVLNLNPTVTASSAPVAPVIAKGGVWTLPKTFQTPLERSLDLGDGVTMPFCACPAGSFTMLDHKVTITRPFWFTKTPVTLKQRLALPRECYQSGFPDVEIAKKINKEFKDTTIIPISYNHEGTIRFLNKKFKHLLPPGYVFRFATEAEFMYAWHAKEDDFGDIWNDQKAGERARAAFVERGWIPADKCPREYDWARFAELPEPNAFGVQQWTAGWVLRFTVLDKINVTVKGGLKGEDQIKAVLQYAEEEVDPLRMTGEYNLACPGRRTLRYSNEGSWGCLCIVIGPDLEAEKKAAKK